MQRSQGEADTEETPLKRSSPQKWSWRNQGKREVKKRVVEVTQGSTEEEVKLPEMKNTREAADRAVTGCADVKRSRRKPVPDLLFCHSGFTRDALRKACQGRAPQATPTPQKS